MRCPECGNKRLIKYGWKFARNPKTGRKRKVQQYQCAFCGRITIYPKR